MIWNRKAVLLLASVVLLSMTLGAYAETLDEWMQRVELGPYATETQDWDAIIAAAKLEGTCVVYASSSRTFLASDSFYEEYGIDVQVYDLGSTGALDKMFREAEAGRYEADVINTGGSEFLYRAIPEQMVFTFVPDRIADYLPEKYKNPALIQRLSLGGIIYNTEANPDGPPIDNVWDLTQPEWRSRVTLKNPMTSESTFNYISNLVNHHEELKAAYEAEYGTLVYTCGIENAGYELIYRVLKNDPVLQSSSENVAIAVGTPGQANPPISFYIGTSKLTLNQTDGLVNAIADIDPVDVQVGETYVAIGAFAKNPNAAKLWIRWTLGTPEPIELGLTELEPPYHTGENGRMLEGFSPWFGPGNANPMLGYPRAQGAVSLDPPAQVWPLDMDFIWENALQIQEFWMIHGG